MLSTLTTAFFQKSGPFYTFSVRNCIHRVLQSMIEIDSLIMPKGKQLGQLLLLKLSILIKPYISQISVVSLVTKDFTNNCKI